MEIYVCDLCGYEYNPDENDGIAFADLAEDWECPLCGAKKSEFSPKQ